MARSTKMTNPRGAAPMRCLNKGCKYADPAAANGCGIFSGAGITDCRALELEPIFSKPKTETKAKKGAH